MAAKVAASAKSVENDERPGVELVDGTACARAVWEIRSPSGT